MNSMKPSLTEKHLCAVKCLEDGKIILGASSLNTRFWTGSLWCFPDIESIPIAEKCIANVDTVSGISDILCFKDEHIIIGKDSGSIDIYKLDSTSEFNFAFSSLEHEDMISSLSANSDESKFASSSYDKSIKIWDTQVCASVATFKPVHAGVVWQAAFSTTDPNVLLSCGSDGLLLLLDLRLPKPATVVDCELVENKPTAVSWKPQSNTIFAVGTQNGNILVQDIRKIGDKLQFKAHNRFVFRLVFSPLKPSWLASCADDTKVLVTDIENSNTVYANEEHSNFVRGLTWNSDNHLITCGFDSKVLKHVVNAEKCDVLHNGL